MKQLKFNNNHLSQSAVIAPDLKRYAKNKMKPSVYLYNETEKGFEIYLGELSTLEGLLLLDKTIEASIITFGATGYKKYGWATEKELPKFRRVGEIASFLETEGDIGIVEFEVVLAGTGSLSTHDDSECHYIVESKQQCMSILKSVISPQYSDMMINKLIGNQGLYLTCSTTGKVSKYNSFDKYLDQNA